MKKHHYCQLRQELLQVWWAIADNSVEVPKKCIRNPLQMYTGFPAPTQLCVALHIALILLHLGQADVIFHFGKEIWRNHNTLRETLVSWKPRHGKSSYVFHGFIGVKKAKLGGKYQAPEVATERGQQDVGEEVMEGVRGDTSKEVMEERNEREEPKIGGNQRKRTSPRLWRDWNRLRTLGQNHWHQQTEQLKHLLDSCW